MYGVIQELGQAVSARWRARGYTERVFASIASAGLKEFELHRHVAQVLDHVFVQNEDLILDDHLSQDVACLYSTAHFGIFLHTWVDGLAPMHHHAWAGAYQLLLGSSVDASYSFREDRHLSAGFLLGQLQCNNIDELSAGDVRPVEPGKNNIHTLSYNNRTALTISVRSRPIIGETTMDYWRPGLAIQTMGALDYVRVRNKCLRYLVYADPAEMLRRLRAWISDGDLRTIFLALEALQSMPKRIPMAEWNELVETGKATHGLDFEPIALAARESARPHWHRRLLARVDAHDYDFRHFLSSLFVFPDRESCLSWIRRADGVTASADKCRDWCRMILEHDHGADVVADWKEGVLAVLDSLLVTGSLSAALTDLSNRYDLDEETMILASEAYRQLSWHPILGQLADT